MKLANLQNLIFQFVVVKSVLVYPPPNPIKFPTSDQQTLINGDLLTDPLIVETVKHVESKVSPKILAIPPSTFIQDSTVTYNAPDPSAAGTCYWAVGQCLRSSDTSDFQADISICKNLNEWGVTYDDGPSTQVPGTKELLSELTSQKLLTTHFVVGTNVLLYPDLLKQIDAAGHQIGVHSWTHHPLTSLSNAQIVAEIKYTEGIIYKTIGKVPIYFRPPYGDVDDRVRAIISALGYKNVMWTIDSSDTSGIPNSEVTARMTKVFEGTNPDTNTSLTTGVITLEHDYLDNTVTSLAALNSYKTSSKLLKPQPVGQCQGLNSNQWYLNSDGSNPANKSGSTDPSKPNTSHSFKIQNILFIFTIIIVTFLF
ncbi:chitin deacetylase [Clydaea vesicula]|uniref:Chitin deacetylase n=1 Tax=Clydaea vesicula TaxID=447962 RepID=A0AAD5U1N0_9FUNG|nr:chitin deacetylase [Clydaea vesicula]